MIAARMEVMAAGKVLDSAVLNLPLDADPEQLARAVLTQRADADSAKVWVGVTQEQPGREPDAEVTR